jgi:hypothetical protein
MNFVNGRNRTKNKIIIKPNRPLLVTPVINRNPVVIITVGDRKRRPGSGTWSTRISGYWKTESGARRRKSQIIRGDNLSGSPG